MSNIVVRFENLARAVRALRALGVDVGDMRNAFSTLSDEGARIAARRAPRRTGRLAGSVRGAQGISKAVISAGDSTVPYAGAINYGWPARGISAAGFMQQADQELEPKVVQLLEQDIDTSIRKRGL